MRLWDFREDSLQDYLKHWPQTPRRRPLRRSGRAEIDTDVPFGGGIPQRRSVDEGAAVLYAAICRGARDGGPGKESGLL
jgi:hypothetical protein